MSRFPPTPVDPQTGRATDETMIDMIVAADALARVYGKTVQSLLGDWAPSHISHARDMAKEAGRL